MTPAEVAANLPPLNDAQVSRVAVLLGLAAGKEAD